MDNEDLIIQKAAEGSEQAFRLLVEKYQSFVFRICLNIVKDSGHAENIAQETFLQIFRALPSYEYKGFKTWIGRIALHKSIDYQRKINAVKKREVALTEEFESTFIEEESSELEGFWRREDCRKIISMCNDLPDIYKTMLIKYYIQEKCYADIAVEEKISVKTVESRLYRARKMLKVKWEVDNL